MGNQINQFSQLNQLGQLRQLQQLNQLNQLNKLNQLNQLQNPLWNIQNNFQQQSPSPKLAKIAKMNRSYAIKRSKAYKNLYLIHIHQYFIFVKHINNIQL